MVRQAILDAFDDNYFSGESNEHAFPFIDHNNPAEVLEWMQKDMEEKFRSRKDRLIAIKKLDAMFKGLPYATGGLKDDEDMIGVRRPKSIYNFMVEMVEAKVSQRARFKPAITVMPQADGLDDENRAESAKLALTAKAQELDLDSLISAGDKTQFLMGESYTYIPWCKYKGGMAPEMIQAQQLGVQPKYEDGSPIEVAFKGDLDVIVLGVDRCYHQLGKKRWEDVNDIDILEWVHTDELKAEYPSVASEIDPSTMFTEFFDADERKEYTRHALVFTYYHKPTRFLPKGKMVKFTDKVVLEITDYPFINKATNQPYPNLPVVFDTDIDVQGEITGRPFTANIEKLQKLHDMISASMARGFAISNSPKWLFQKGSIDPNKLGNAYSSLEVKGPIMPQLVSFNGVPSTSLDLLQWAEKGIEKAATIYGVSRGEPPKGIKAAVALQFLDEQELQRESRGMAKRQRRIIEIYKMILERMQQFYTPEDGRLLAYLGEDNSNMLVDFSSMNLEGQFDIKIENSSALPDSKTGKIAAILDLNTATQADPMFGKEEIAQMLELGNDRRFKNQKLSSMKACQFKLQQILTGAGQPEPRPWDDFLVEYPIFVETLRQREYKGEDQKIMQSLEIYIKGMEFEMWKKAQINPAFKQKVMMFPQYPVFFQVPMMGAPTPMAPGAPAEQGINSLPSEQNALQDQKQIIGEQQQGAR